MCQTLLTSIRKLLTFYFSYLSLTEAHYRRGEDVVIGMAGKDATEVFEDVGHSDEARAILPQLQVGTLKDAVYKVRAVTFRIADSLSN